MLRKIFKYTLIAIFTLVPIIALSIFIYSRTLMPNYEGSLKMEVLNSEVEVNFDAYGIPHIYAENAEDAYRALGYVHAQDRLFQMEMIRRLSAGRLSEILGDKLVKTDKFFRTLGLRKMAEENAKVNFEKVEYDWQRHTLAYLEGLNEYVDNGSTPIEFTILGIPKSKFEPADVYSVLAYTGLGFSKALKDDPIIEKIRLKNGDEYFDDWLFDTNYLDSLALPKSNESDLSNLIPRDVESYLDAANLPLWYGSNGWVVSPEKSESGSVILANDTHIGVSQPSVWYEAHISYPGFDFYGNYLAGVPFAIIGHTRDLGWGLTIFPFDGIDLYREKSNPDVPNQVWENDKWVEMDVQEEIIRVKDGDDIRFDRKVSRHGPVINDVAGTLDTFELEPVTFWWNYLEKTTSTLDAIYSMNHAKDMAQFKEGVSKIDYIGLNVLYGDKKGNIAHWGAGEIPRRPPHVNPKFILDGASGKDELLGYYDFSENPTYENPEQGYVASGNNDPGVVNGNYFTGYYCTPNRYERIKLHLEAKGKLSQEDMKSIQLDEISDDHKRIAVTLSSIIANTTMVLDQISKEALTALENWDGGYELGQIEPTIYTKLIYHTMHNTMVDEVGYEDFTTLQGSYIYKGSLIGVLENENSVWWDDVTTDDIKESREDAVVKAFVKTIKELKIQLGEDQREWKWERVHFVTHNHPLGIQKPLDKIFNVGPYAISGGNDVPNKMMYSTNGDGIYNTYSSPALRIIFDFANVGASESINPTGQSGNIMSPHYKDQTLMFNEGIYRPQLMDKEDILEKGKTLVLKPKS